MRRFRSVAVPAVTLAVMLGGTVGYGRLAPAVGTAAGTALSAHARSSPSSSPSESGGTALPAGHAWTVTLVTGDVVGVRTVSGRPPLVTIQPGRGRKDVIFSKYVDTRGHIVVLPHDVAPLAGSVLDPALFDVTTLILNGDDDAHRFDLPLIVQGAGGTSGAAAAVALSPSLRPGRVLSSIGAVAVEAPKAEALQGRKRTGRDETVSSPAAASAALAVGAVDGRDRLAAFSSRGPRLGDFAIKPEIVAPGVDIVGRPRGRHRAGRPARRPLHPRCLARRWPRPWSRARRPS
jgi:Subtilase family